ncbi:hypothetical protein BGZ61DRAFT_377022, partial [Ilyonectria robusta]|uniref:uncharacterized protein n=1 Tax=Ilyonectria robusta TaxID=1079257 RepID=UPI001E8DAF5D
RHSHKGIIIASPVAVNLAKGTNTLTIGGLSNGNGTKAADVDKIIVHPLESKWRRCNPKWWKNRSQC